jgi:hypothetical protein
VNKNATVGVSLGVGKGLSYGSIHDRALGLDATLQWRNWRVYSEYLVMQRRAADRFQFRYAKLAYDKFGVSSPLQHTISWDDKSGTFGRFRSTAYGATYQINPRLLLEAGLADTGTDTIYWAQMHIYGRSPCISGKIRRVRQRWHRHSR